MSDQNHDAQNFALMVLPGVVALVIVIVIVLARSSGIDMSPSGDYYVTS